MDSDASSTNPTQDWQLILHASNQVVLYNPTSHALSIRHTSSPLPSSHSSSSSCPYCHRPLQNSSLLPYDTDWFEGAERASNYFQLLAVANERSSRPSTPPQLDDLADDGDHERGDGENSGGLENGDGIHFRAFKPEAMAKGYFRAFFQVVCKLGMGANGSVFLCQHLLDGNPLGHFAVKKIAVGESHSYLLQTLREVRLLERLHHPNIIMYHHAWLEECQFSDYGPPVPTLHVLMEWAEGGSLDDFIDHRLGRDARHSYIYHAHPSSRAPATPSTDTTSTSPSSHEPPNAHAEAHPHWPPPNTTPANSASGRKRLFRAFQAERRNAGNAGISDTSGATATVFDRDGKEKLRAVHLLSAEEIRELFRDVVEGLAFLHQRSILHLDLKPGNVLLTWDEGTLIPRAMLSDFGTSRDMLQSNRVRSGNTGTLEYSPPESLPSPRTGLLSSLDSKADVWSLGMILHKMIFFKLPYRYANDGEGEDEEGGENGWEGEKMSRLEQEVVEYSGFKATANGVKVLEARRLPRAFLFLLETLLNVTPSARPSCDRVSSAIREGRLDPISAGPRATEDDEDDDVGTESTSVGSLVPARNSHSHFRPPLDEGDDVSRHGESDGLVPEVEKDVRMRRSPVLLGLPAPPAWRRRWWSSLSWWVGVYGNASVDLGSVIGVRLLKSSLLVVKVWSISALMHRPVAPPFPTLAVTFLLSAAVLDTLNSGLWVSVALGGIHYAGLWVLSRW